MQLRVLAFVLAGGKGTRLSPLTKERAKPAVPFGGRYRIVDFVLSNLINSGIYSIYVLDPVQEPVAAAAPARRLGGCGLLKNTSSFRYPRRCARPKKTGTAAPPTPSIKTSI